MPRRTLWQGVGHGCFEVLVRRVPKLSWSLPTSHVNQHLGKVEASVLLLVAHNSAWPEIWTQRDMRLVLKGVVHLLQCQP